MTLTNPVNPGPAFVLTVNSSGVAVGFPITASEIAAGVTPVDITFSPGNVLRYGKNTVPGTTDMAAAFNAAIASNDYVFIPSGSFLINSQINVNRSDITIEGTNQGLEAGFGHAFRGGSYLILGPGAGPGAAMFFWGNTPYQSINLRRFAITLNNAGLQQIGIRIGQAIDVQIEQLMIEGQGTTSDDSIGIQLDGYLPAGGFGYTGDFNIFDNYITNNLIGINVQGGVTTLRIVSNEIQGSGGHNSNIGIKLGNAGVTTAVSQPLLAFNSLLQCRTGIQSYAVGARQIGGRFEGCNPAIMGGNWPISGITQAASAVVTISTASATNPFQVDNYAITGISQAGSAVVTFNTVSPTNPVSVNAVMSFSGVSGMTQINGLVGTVTAVGGVSGAWTATVNINSGGFGAWTSGGQMATGGIGNAMVFAGVGGMTQINGLQGVITAVAGISGAWTATVAINSSAFTAYTSGGTAQTAMNFNWVRGLGSSNIQNSSVYEAILSGVVNYPQNTTDLAVFLGPATSYGFLPTSINGAVLFNNAGQFASSPNLTYGSNILQVSNGSFYNQTNPTACALAMNGGAHYGQVQTIGTTTWGLGWGSSNVTLGTPVIQWTDTNQVGLCGAAPASQSTGWGTPTGGGVVNNFAGSAATLASTGQAVSQIIIALKSFGLLGT